MTGYLAGWRHPRPISLPEGGEFDLSEMRLLITLDWKPERIRELVQGPIKIAFRRLSLSGPPVIHCGARFFRNSPPFDWEQSWHYHLDTHAPEPLPDDDPEMGYTFSIHGIEHRTQLVVESRFLVLSRPVSHYLRAFAIECQGNPVSYADQRQIFLPYLDRFPVNRLFQVNDVSMKERATDE